MLKFAKNYLETIDGVATYPMISLAIFFLFFVALSACLFPDSKTYINLLIPLQFAQDGLESHTSSAHSTTISTLQHEK